MNLKDMPLFRSSSWRSYRWLWNKHLWMIHPHRTYQTFPPPKKKPMKSSMRISLLVYLVGVWSAKRTIPQDSKPSKSGKKKPPVVSQLGAAPLNEMRFLGYAQVLRWKVPGANPAEILMGELSTWKTSCTLWYTGTLYTSRYIPMPW